MFQYLNKIKLINVIVITLLLVVLVFLVALVYSDYQQKKLVEEISTELKLKTSKEKIVSYEETTDKATSEPIVSYIYITEKPVITATYKNLPEDIAQRTKNSQVYIAPSSDPKVGNYVAKIYAGQPFALDGDTWKETDYATTTKTAFLQQTENTILDKAKSIFGQPVFAGVDTTYTGVGDGSIKRNDSPNWSTVHDATTGNSTDYTSAYVALISGNSIFGDDYIISRLFLPFDTSGLAGGGAISQATLYFMPLTSIFYTADAYAFITTVSTSQASNTALVNADYDTCGNAISNPTEGNNSGSRVEFSALVGDSYSSISLNATGISWINDSGYTKLGLRAGYDVLNVDPGNSLDSANIYMSEQTGTASDPYLEVSYTLPITFKIDGGRVKIDGGRVKID